MVNSRHNSNGAGAVAAIAKIAGELMAKYSWWTRTAAIYLHQSSIDHTILSRPADEQMSCQMWRPMGPTGMS
jgi:hypothetical protein